MVQSKAAVESLGIQPTTEPTNHIEGGNEWTSQPNQPTTPNLPNLPTLPIDHMEQVKKNPKLSCLKKIQLDKVREDVSEKLGSSALQESQQLLSSTCTPPPAPMVFLGRVLNSAVLFLRVPNEKPGGLHKLSLPTGKHGRFDVLSEWSLWWCLHVQSPRNCAGYKMSSERL